MRRLQINVEEEQYTWLRNQSFEHGQSISQLLRELIRGTNNILNKKGNTSLHLDVSKDKKEYLSTETFTNTSEAIEENKIHPAPKQKFSLKNKIR